MKIIQDVLKACGYGGQDAFSFSYKNDQEAFSRAVYPFVSEQYPDDVYLLVPVSPEVLSHALGDAFLPALASGFRKQKFHKSSMDRNTTLVLICRCAAGESIDHRARVQLEDDPYYFKKYVFVCSEQAAQAAERYLAEHREMGESLTGAIRGCLLDTARFAGYKAGDPEQSAYAYFVELATKVTVLPIQPESKSSIRTVQSIWDEKLRDKPAIDLEALERVLDCVPENDKEKFDPDKVLDLWQASKKPGRS